MSLSKLCSHKKNASLLQNLPSFKVRTQGNKAQVQKNHMPFSLAAVEPKNANPVVS